MTGNRLSSFFIRLALALATAGRAAAPSPAGEGIPFRFDPTVGRVQLWGVPVPQFPRVFFPEMLPAVFERTLQMERCELAGGTLEWVFTGDRGGFTIQVQAGKIRVFQRYYDSFGYWKPQEKPQGRPIRHPEQVFADSSADCPNAVRELQVRLDHKLGLSTTVNGTELVRQPCLLDVSRHQLAYFIPSDKAGEVRGRLLPQQAEDAWIRVDPSKRHQTMIGFGGITSPTAYVQLSPDGKRRWWEILAEYNLLLHREYPMGAKLNSDLSNWDRLEDALPTYYGDNFPNGQVSDFDYMRRIRGMGGQVLFEFWDLPLQARREGTDAKGAVVKDMADPDAYARAVVNYCRTSQQRAGAPPDVVGIQNEKVQPAPVWHEMTLKLRRELDRAGFGQVKIHMQDAITLEGGIASARQFRQSEAAWRTIDYSATHLYDYQPMLYDPDGFDRLLKEWSEITRGKPFISTEMCVNRDPYQVPSYRLAFGMGQLYHKNLTLTDAVALLYCFLLVNTEQPSYAWTRTLLGIDHARGSVPAPFSHQLRVFGAFSRRIRAGMVRLAIESSGPDLLATAFAGRDGERTLVVLNRSTRIQRVSLRWEGKPFRILELTDPYNENAVRPAPAARAGSAPAFEIHPGAIMTLTTAGRTSPGKS